MKVCFKILLCLAAILPLLHVRADSVIYDTSGTYNTNVFPISNGEEIGNQITLSPNTWSMTSFQIEYYSTNILQPAKVGVDLRFYMNNGVAVNGAATPGTVFYDSGWNYGLTAGPLGDTIAYESSDLYQNALLNLPAGFLLPDTFTFTLTFTNLDANNTVSLPLANSPANQPATSFGTYWLNSSGQWALLTNSAPANFVTVINGTSVPEPAASYLGALGVLALLTTCRWARQH